MLSRLSVPCIVFCSYSFIVNFLKRFIKLSLIQRVNRSHMLTCRSSSFISMAFLVFKIISIFFFIVTSIMIISHLFILLFLLIMKIFKEFFFILSFLFLNVFEFILSHFVFEQQVVDFFLSLRSSSFCKILNNSWPVNRFGRYFFLHSIKDLLKSFSRDSGNSFWLSCYSRMNSFNLRVLSNFNKEVKEANFHINSFKSWAGIKYISY